MGLYSTGKIHKHKFRASDYFLLIITINKISIYFTFFFFLPYFIFQNFHFTSYKSICVSLDQYICISSDRLNEFNFFLCQLSCCNKPIFPLCFSKYWRRKRQPTPVFLPEHPTGRGAWKAIQSTGSQELDVTQCLNHHIRFSVGYCITPAQKLYSRNLKELSAY